MTDPAEVSFSLVVGGPFYRLQQRLGLLGPDLLPPLRTALLLVLLAWLPPALLAMAQGHAWDSTLGERAFLLDFSVHARFIIAILMFTVMERIAERRIAGLVRQFSESRLVAEEEQGRFRAALQRADRRSSSAPAEFVMLVLAYVAAVNGIALQLEVVRISWLGTLAGGGMSFTLAGWWVVLVSLPLFWFLLLRWLWRFVVWSMLLRDFALLKLRLVATHPDRSGGVGFMAMFPPTFAVLVFALSCVTASVALQELVFADISLETLVMQFLVWLVLVVLIFVGPLLAFIRPLARLRDHALLEYGRLASVYSRAFESQWLDQEQLVDGVSCAEAVSFNTDLAYALETVSAMRVIPVGRETFIPLIIAAGLPWLAVLLTQISLFDILKTTAQALL